MKENRIHTMFRLGIVLVFALILGLSSFFADQSAAVYAGEPETVAENTETADELTGETEAVTEEATETVSDTQETGETTETDSNTQDTEEPEYIAPDVKITIEPQEGWHKKEAVVYVSVEDILMTGNFSMESVKVKFHRMGAGQTSRMT